jgi:HEAT repeat protein
MKAQQLRALSPATLELTRSLYRKPGLIDRWNADARTIKTIYKIGAANEAAAIRDLMSFGLSRDREVRTAARANIEHLLSLVPVEALPVLDDWLRQTWEFLEDWYGLQPKGVGVLRPDTHADRVFLGLIASHRSGFVREEAIRILGLDESESIVPFLLIRLADWVNPVRLAAEREVVRRLEPRYARIFVDCLALMDRLGDTTRFSRSISHRVDELLQAPQCADELRRGMNHASRGIRRRCFRIAARAPQLPVADVVAHAIRDHDVVVRRWAFAAATEMLPDNRIALREQAARDSYAPIRRVAFEAVAADPGSHLSDFEFFLMDRSAPIRRECQAVVAKRFAFPAADFYRARLLVPHARQIEVAVLGISETGGPKDAGAMITLLDHWSVRVRRAAIRAARTVGAKVSSVLLLNTIALDRPSVVREAVLALLAERMISAESIWAATTKNPDHRARIAALNALQIADKWTQIRLYLDAAADAEPSLSRRAVELIGLWVRKFNTTFTQPTTEDKIAVSSALAAIKNFLPNELSRELMFIVQTSLR